MQEFRREFLKMAGLSVAGGATTLVRPLAAQAQQSARPAESGIFWSIWRLGKRFTREGWRYRLLSS